MQQNYGVRQRLSANNQVSGKLIQNVRVSSAVSVCNASANICSGENGLCVYAFVYLLQDLLSNVCRLLRKSP